MAGISGVLTSAQYEVLNTIDSSSSNKSYQDQQVLDKDAFLKLMMTQLQYQDPLDPMDNTEYIAQMAQFSSVEQLANISSEMASSNEQLDTLSVQVDSLAEIIASMNDSFTSNNSNTSDIQTALLYQNQAILEQLMKLNDAFETYFGTTSEDDSIAEDATAEDILSSLLG